MEGNPQPQTRVRTAGGGRKKLAETDPALSSELRRPNRRRSNGLALLPYRRSSH